MCFDAKYQIYKSLRIKTTDTTGFKHREFDEIGTKFGINKIMFETLFADKIYSEKIELFYFHSFSLKYQV